jgi:hypothetical protein
MWPDSAAERQAHDLAVIHAFFSSILEEIMGEPVPGPRIAGFPLDRILHPGTKANHNLLVAT